MQIICPKCASSFQAPKEVLGKKAKCGSCHHVFVVENPDSAAEKETHVHSITPNHQSNNNSQELAWVSLYLAAMAALLLLARGNHGGLIASLLVGLAMESAVVFFAVRGFLDAKQARSLHPASHLARTGLLVNGALLGLIGFSLLLTLYSLIAGSGSGSTAGTPGLNDLMKMINQQGNQMSDILKSIK